MDKRYLGLAVFILIFIIGGAAVYYGTKNNKSKKLLKGDSIVYVHDTVYVEKKGDKKPIKPIPSITKYKVTDWVCAWGKWTGVVTEINWSEKNPSILKHFTKLYV